MKPNFKSIMLTGLLAGLTILISGLSMIPVVGDEMDRILSARGLPPLSGWAISFIIFESICNGIFLAFLYSMLKAYIRSKLKAAVTASLIVFFMRYFLGNASLVMYGFMPLKFTIIGTLWGLGELILAGIIVSKLYKDAHLQSGLGVT